MSDDNGDNGDLPDDELQALRDRAVGPRGLKAWILRGAAGNGVRDPRFEPLRKAMLKDAGGGGTPHNKLFPSKFDREVWAKSLDYDPEMIELLALAEMEWRADLASREMLDKKMEIDTTSAFDFRNPSQHQAQFCRYKGANGKTFCRQPAIPGTVRCQDHGGELVDVSTRRAVLMSSYLQIVEATSVAVDTLVDVTLHSRNDLARVQAAKEILDRAGLTAELNVTIKLEGQDRDEKMDKLREKLDSMQRGLMHQVSIDTTST